MSLRPALAALAAHVVADVAYLVVVVVVASRLPARVPIHFGGSGEADRWASRTGAVATFAGVGLGVALLLALSVVAVRRTSLSHVNVPHRAWWTATPERVALLRDRLAADVHLLAVATMVLLSVVVLLTLRAARAPEPRLDAWAVVAVAAYLVVLMGWTVRALTVRYRPWLA